MRLGVGIDTGGTYTDAVLYDYEAGAVLGSAKAPTTRQDLSVGILAALDGLPAELARQAEVISLSTTLTTNACVENKMGRAKLVFFGGDPGVIDRLGGAYGLPPAREMVVQESYTDFSGGVAREPDWDLFDRAVGEDLEELDGIGIVELYAIKNGAVVERAAKERLRARCGLPIICGHELFSELNSLQRASSTLLNAGLVGVLETFLDAIERAVRARGMGADVVIMRSDGSLMSEAFARVHPVETLLCGPAASVMGGWALAKRPDCVIVDMGGTTTDIALLQGGEPIKALGGVRIGGWKTLVDGLYVKTIGLGGDSAIHSEYKKLILETYRVKPLCALAAEYPQVLEDLERVAARRERHTCPLHEHYLLLRDIGESGRYTEEERAFCAALRAGPLCLEKAARAVGKDAYTLNVDRLIREGVVQLCGLTPTDVMHLRGDCDLHPVRGAELAARFVAMDLEIPVEELCERVYEAIRRRLYENIAQALLENKYPRYRKEGVGREVEGFIRDSYELAKAGETDGLLTLRFGTRFTLLGVGAPTAVFLHDVAALLGTEAVIPEHHEVANALGAVVGNVAATGRAEVQPIYNTGGITGYTVFCREVSRHFADYDEALAFGVREAERTAREDAARRGARGNVAVTVQTQWHEGVALDEVKLHLGTTVTARAVGTLGTGTPGGREAG